jgi:hypothetical protein
MGGGGGEVSASGITNKRLSFYATTPLSLLTRGHFTLGHITPGV